MNSINKGGAHVRTLFWGAFAGLGALYEMMTKPGSSKRTVLVKDVVAEVAEEALTGQAGTPTSLVPFSQRAIPLSVPECLLLAAPNLYSDSEDTGVSEKVSHTALGWSLGIGAVGAAVPLLTGGAAGSDGGAASEGVSSFSSVWNYFSTPLQIGITVIGILGTLYTAYKIHQAWKKYWESANAAAPVNNNTNTNTLTNNMHINVQLAPGMKLTKTIDKDGREVFEIRIEDAQARKRADATA